MDEELATKLACALEEVGLADKALTDLLGQIQVAPRAEKRAVSDAVADALAKLQVATTNLVELQRLIDRELGGGASVAVLSIQSSLSLSGCTLITGGGGTGGQGGSGEDGQPGGAGAAGNDGTLNPGGHGANGAGGSGGAGGTGGLSAGIVFQGSAPVLQSCTFTVGEPGHGGAGGTPGSATQPWAGLPGSAGFDEYPMDDAGLGGPDAAEFDEYPLEDTGVVSPDAAGPDE